MHSYVARLAVLVPAIFALSGGAALVDLNLSDGRAVSSPGPGPHFYELRLEPINTLRRDRCDCTYIDMSKPAKSGCETLSPAQRMGMSIRLASL